ncbi:6554_t:CDS:1, partial [Paraglomus brasilianum]
HDAYKQGQKTKREKYDLKSKSLEAAREDNKQAQIEENEWKKKYDDIAKREEKRNQEVKNIQEKLKDPNLSDKKRGELEERLTSLLAQQDEDKKEKDKIMTKLKQLGDRIKNNNKIISGVGLNTDEKH